MRMRKTRKALLEQEKASHNNYKTLNMKEILGNISSFARMQEPDRMVFVAKVHHAIWHNENLYQKVKAMIESAEDRLPSAEYFPPTPHKEL